MNVDSISGKVIVEVDNGWISVSRENSEKHFRLINVKKIILTNDFIFIYMNDIEAIIIPKDTFELELEIEVFTQLINSSK